MTTTANGTSPQIITTADKSRILCVADIRGQLTILNQLAKTHNASYIIHTGDFGFYDVDSVQKISERTLRHVAQYSPLLENPSLPKDISSLRQYLLTHPISQLHQFLSGEFKLDVPVYTVHGACEDVSVLEKFRSAEYKVPNLFIVDEHSSRSIDTGNGVKFRLLGLGGALVIHKLFDNGSGRTTIAGGSGTTWTTLLQIGELIDTAARVFDESETRIFISHASPAREGILAQLALALNADFSVSGGLHFRYGCSYNEFAVNPTHDYFRGKLAGARAQFMDVWDIVKGEVEPAIAHNPTQKQLINNALAVIERMPKSAQNSPDHEKEEINNIGFRNMWHFNLTDASYGSLVLDVKDGKIGVETKSEGFDFKYRRHLGDDASKPGTTRPVATNAVPTAAPRKQSLPANGTSSHTAEPPIGPKAEEIKKEVRTSEPKPDQVPPFIGQAEKTSATEGEAQPIVSTAPAPPAPAPAPEEGEKEKEPSVREPKRPGLWVARADYSEDTLRSYFAQVDQPNITSVLIKTSLGGKKFAHVYFDTVENSLAALDRVDSSKLGRVTVLNEGPIHSGKPFGASRGTWRYGPGGELDGSRRDSIKTRVSGGRGTIARGRGRGRGGPPIPTTSGEAHGDRSASASTSPASTSTAPAPASSSS
ncbi:hypothetical protein V1514DRAFT_331439 [Lipomyces japonicus]|uniref:uncharacterized protein n=1 Tax=Lipomyces japonicus TaxID=56871 RepID=UPI0034CFE6E6